MTENMTEALHNHAQCTADLIARAQEICAQRGTKLTVQRKDILQSVAESHNAVGAYDIIERMAAAGPRPAPITVYRALDFLLDHDLVHKVESRNAFVACTCAHVNNQPTLLVCDECGVVEEVVEPRINANLAQTAATRNFHVTKTVIELSGTCGHCTKKS